MSNETERSITAEALLKLDHREITIVDLRESDEVLVHSIDGAVNIPFPAT